MPVFEHLDDPRPTTASAETRQAVAQRIADRRARQVRRQRAVLIGVLGAMIPMVAALAVLAGRDHATSPATIGTTSSSSSTSTGPSSTSTVVAPSTSAPPAPTSTTTATPAAGALAAISDLDFTSTSTGWALGWTACAGPQCLALRHTTDGGATWRSAAAPPVSTDSAGTYRVRFGPGGNGYVFAPDLWVTHDGAATWQQVHVSGTVLALEPEGDDVLALVRPCEGSCPLSLIHSTDAGRTWSPEPLPSGVAGQQGQLVRQNPDNGWVVASSLDATSTALARTTDGGSKWVELASPCPQPGFGVDITFVDAAHLWMGCAGDSAAGQQGKDVFRSADAGDSWQPTGALPLGGYLSNVAAPSADAAFVALGRGTLLGTSDGGATWHEAIPFAKASPSDAGVGPVRFVDSAHGWVGARDAKGAAVVWLTTDGGTTWTPVPVA